MFGDVKYCITGGSPNRMLTYAQKLKENFKLQLPAGLGLQNICETDRYAMYKVGPVLLVSHGMGIPSMCIMLHELGKLFMYSKIMDKVQLVRIGTSGGVGIEPGSVVVSDKVFNTQMEELWKLHVCNRVIERKTKLNKALSTKILAAHKRLQKKTGDSYLCVSGNTLCTTDFYEEQARMDGLFCEISEQEKIDYVKFLSEKNVKNIEMESLVLAAFTNHANISAACICCTLLDRLKGDQIDATKEAMDEWQMRPFQIMCELMK
ncbi:hypothetical protein SNEBB_005398 [Seison nebaliae]|nr:hypothetical protein SNEBB_005398 [Seison nebaliae]